MDEKTLVKIQCMCVIKNREENESQRDWLKRCMCMFHWMQTDYYQGKFEEKQNEHTRMR